MSHLCPCGNFLNGRKTYCSNACRLDADRVTPERFWSKVVVSGDDECWIWQGCVTQNGYGRTAGEYAHRKAYTFTIGVIPPDAVVRHCCDRPLCCNPAHLSLGTQADNMRDCVERGRLWTPWADRNPMAKLNWELVDEIRQRHSKGESMRSIGRAFGVTHGTVSRVVNERGWKPEWSCRP